MKILLATNNSAKTNLYRNILKNDSLEIVTLKDLNIKVDVAENGKTVKENAEKKAKTYSNMTGLITIADDTSLILENVPSDIQKTLFVKKIDGIEKNDDELIEHYSNLFKKYGDNIKGIWHKCFSIAFKDECNSFEYDLSELFVSTPSQTKTKGFPLDSLTIVEKYNKYLSELTEEEEKNLMEEQDLLIREFFNDNLQKLKRKQGIFIACPIGKYIKDDSVNPVYENFIRSIVSLCREYSDNVFIALEREKYGKVRMLGDTCTPDDYDKMKKTTYLLAIPEDSMGVSVELGWASADKKDIFLILDKKYNASEIVKHIHTVTDGDKIVIDTTTGGYETEKEKIFAFIKECLEKRF